MRVATWLPIVLTAISLLGGGLAWAAKTQTEAVVNDALDPVESRVTKLETQRVEDVKRQEEIKKKVDQVDDKIDALKTLIIDRLPKK
jgi:TolA-binding protein